MNSLVENKFFETNVPDNEVAVLASAIQSFTKEGRIATPDLYAAVNRAVSSNSIEGKILLRVSKFFTAVFAIFMGFLIGSAVGPASLTILMERANGIFIGAGAVGGLILGVAGWAIKAAQDNDGTVAYETLGQDWPW